MKLITRYVVREHIGPLIFALSALTSLLMLQYVARQLANLAGKGLPWKAIGQFFVLSLPFTIAMTMPMAVLVATLYAFGRMAAEHEITAFKASGVRVRSLMVPVLVGAFLLSLGMVAFNDQVLPRANHKLRVLQQDIAKTKPTLALRDQVLNTLKDGFYIRVARSDADSNRMYDVVLYDLSNGNERKTIYADSGLFLLAPNGKDLQLHLFSGVSQEFVRGDNRRFQRSFFQEQVVKIQAVSQGFETSQSDTYKSDREMSICEMQRKYAIAAVDFKRLRDEYIMYASRLAGPDVKSITAPRDRPPRDAAAYFYCVTVPSWFSVKSAEAHEPALASAIQPPTGQPPVVRPPSGQPPVVPPPGQPPVVQPPVVQPPVVKPPVMQTDSVPAGAAGVPVTVDSNGVIRGVQVVPGQVVSGQVVPGQVVPGQVAPGQVAGDSTQPVAAPVDSALIRANIAAGVPANSDTAAMYEGAMLAATTQLGDARDTLDSLSVEIQKKFALSFACFVFVLFGPPIALRFPRGGVGVTIGVSLVVFSLYYICLMGGEALADKGQLPAYVAMWIANVIFTIAGVALLWRVESTVDSSRGGGFGEWWRDRKAKKMLSKERQARQKAAPAAGATA